MAESFFWKDKEKEILKNNLFSETAENKAREIAQDTQQKAPSYTQLRKFYDEVVLFKTQLSVKNDKEIFEQKLPYIKMINAKMAYSYARKQMSKNCFDFFKKLVNEINDYNDFKAFADFFEAFMAFYRSYNNK